MAIWLRALLYMLGVGGGWLVVLPALIIGLEYGHLLPPLRGLGWAGLGVLTFMAGVGLAWWAGYHLITYGRGTPMPLDPPRKLVTSGPYRFVRNPQAIAMVLMVTGEVLAVSSRWLWLLLPLTLFYLEGLVGPWEERQLAGQFGLEYLRYQQNVRKWRP